MTEAELQVPFARQYGPEIAALAPEGQAGALAFRIGLLPEAARRIGKPSNPEMGDTMSAYECDNDNTIFAYQSVISATQLS